MNDEYYKNKDGLVNSIFISVKKGAPRKQIQEGAFTAGFGLVGDVNSGKIDKNVVILGMESRKEIEKYKKEGLCLKRFHETIRVSNIELYRLGVGTKIMIGDTIHQITYIGKACFDECKLVKKKDRCPLSSQVVFTKVIKGGTIRTTDSVKIL